MINFWPWLTTRKSIWVVLVFFQLCSASCYAENNGEVNTSCYAKQADEWLVSINNRIRAHDKLFQYALKNYGEPDSCTGRVTAEFDGKKYGDIKFAWNKGQSFSVSTIPPESSIVKLESKDGFENSADIRVMAKQYTRELGLEVDWSVAAKNSTTTGTVEEFTAKPVGMNVTVRFHYNKEQKLTSVIVSMAL